MPRTKQTTASKHSKLKASKVAVDLIIKRINEKEQQELMNIEKKLNLVKKEIKNEFLNLRSQIPPKMLLRTVGEVERKEVHNSQLSNTIVLSDLTNTFDSTKGSLSTTKTARKIERISRSNSATRAIGTSQRVRPQRSISAHFDEGYTTSESSCRGSTDNHPNTRQSRSRTRTITKGPARSLSRNDTTHQKPTRFRTPINKQPPPTNAGTITPKCKPNTPLLYVRRPKVGEIGWSNQGSPLLISGTVAPEAKPNINIPVGGDIISMLPTKGVMRESQIPDMDEETRRHLEILRDNLIKVCETMKK